MCYGCSKELSHRDSSFEYPQHKIDCEIRTFHGPVFGVYSFSLLRKSLWWLVAGTVVEIDKFV